MIIALIGVAAAIVLFVVLSGDDEEQAATPTTTVSQGTGPDGQQGGGQPKPDKPKPAPVATIQVKDGQPVGGVQELTFTKGDVIRFAVESDIEEELHLHTYDIEKPISPGETVEFEVPAELEGVFELELEESAVPLAEISVTPG